MCVALMEKNIVKLRSKGPSRKGYEGLKDVGFSPGLLWTPAIMEYGPPLMNNVERNFKKTYRPKWIISIHNHLKIEFLVSFWQMPLLLRARPFAAFAFSQCRLFPTMAGVGSDCKQVCRGRIFDHG